MSAASEQTPPRRRRGPVVAIAALVLLVVALVVADGVVRGVAEERVREQVGSAVGVPADEVEATVHGFPVLLQLAQGRLQEVDATVPGADLGAVSGDLEFTATGVPTSAGGAVDSVEARFAMSEDDLARAGDLFGLASITGVSIVEPEVRVGAEFEVFGIAIGVAVGLEPSIEDGSLVVTPSSVALNGAQTTVQAIRDQFGTLLDGVLQPRSVCLADRLPASLTLESAEVDGDRLVVALGGSEVLLDAESLESGTGSCAG